MIFQHFPHTKVWGCKFDLVVIIIHYHFLYKIGRPCVRNAIYQDSASKLSWFWRRRFLSLFTKYGQGGHLVQWHGTIQINCQYPFDRRPHVKSGENCSSGFREEVRSHGFPIGAIFAILDPQVILLLQCNFQFKSLTVWEKSKIGFQDGGHFGFLISTIFASFHLHVNLLLHHKFQLNSPCGLREDVQNRLSRWRLWRPSWDFRST